MDMKHYYIYPLLALFATASDSENETAPTNKINGKLRSVALNQNDKPLPKIVLLGSPPMKRAYKDANSSNNIHQDVSNNIDWSNVVIIIPTYNDKNNNELVQSSYSTWMRHIGDRSDVILVTDSDDVRTNEEILPSQDDMNNIQANIHVYRSDAKNEGRRTRYKVIDAFNHALSLFEDDERKQIFLKIDTDSYVIPENIIDAIGNIQKGTYPLPAEFGRGLCLTPDTCYSHGGTYGFNRIGLKLMLSYVSNNPDIYEKDIKNELNNDNLMAHEDYLTSYAFKEGTKSSLSSDGDDYYYYPIINMRGVSESIMRLKQPFKKIGGLFCSIHNVKNPNDFHALQKLFYDENDNVIQQLKYDENGSIVW